MKVPLGIIEGYYGRPWSWEARSDTVSFLAPRGYGAYFYAPKADALLRKRWRERHPADVAERMRQFAALCKSAGVAFGIGLSPFELYRNFDDDARRDLKAKLKSLEEMGAEVLAILFDDMRGDLPNLAASQIRILHWIRDNVRATRLVVCPSYYSDDPVLDRFFGERPEGYLAELGRDLDPAIEVFWTGEEVCARELSVGHLASVGELLRRKPLLWDNYPVNDGPRMSPYLHIRAFTGRPAAIGAGISGHMINPALQPTLTLISALSLAESYQRGDRYAYGAAFERAAEEVLGHDLARLVREDLLFLQDVGRDKLGGWAEQLRARYAGIDHPAAREICAWLDGYWAVEKFEE